MSRLNKYMVYNPLREKPKRVFANYNNALDVCKELSKKTGEKFLLLKVVNEVNVCEKNGLT